MELVNRNIWNIPTGVSRSHTDNLENIPRINNNVYHVYEITEPGSIKQMPDYVSSFNVLLGTECVPFITFNTCFPLIFI